MNWLMFAVASWVLFGLELGLRDAFAIGPTGVAPSLVLPFVVVVALGAPGLSASWSAFFLGVVTDLAWPIETRAGGAPVTLVGPHAVGYVIAAQFVLAMRGVVMKRNPLAVGFLSAVGGMIAQAVVVGFFTLRKVWGDPIPWDATDELFRRFLGAVYTGGAGVVLAMLLIPLGPALGLATGQARRFARRADGR